jgi:hypothetical protein
MHQGWVREAQILARKRTTRLSRQCLYDPSQHSQGACRGRHRLAGKNTDILRGAFPLYVPPVYKLEDDTEGVLKMVKDVVSEFIYSSA